MARLEKLANIAIIVTCILLCVTVWRRGFGSGDSDRPPGEIRPSERLALTGYDWSGSSRTLVLALRSDCHFCTESAPFYRKLLGGMAGSSAIRAVAVMPGSEEDSRRYLGAMGVALPEIRKSALSALKVPGTPTLLLVNRDGVVVRVWKGKLSPDAEQEVFRVLGISG